MVTTIDQKIAEWFNSNFGLGGEWPWGNLILCIICYFTNLFNVFKALDSILDTCA